MSRDSMFNARFGALSSGLGSYPSRTVRGMYQQEQQITKAEDAGLIVTASDLYPVYCPVCGHTLLWVHDELTCFNCCAEVE